jgi:hypothetical protein
VTSSRAGAHALGPIIISFRTYSGGLSTRCSVCLRNSEVVRNNRTRQAAIDPPFATQSRNPANEMRFPVSRESAEAVAGSPSGIRDEPAEPERGCLCAC